MSSVRWNDDVRLIISDVDDTIAPLYEPASPLLITQLNRVLSGGRVLFLISGQSVDGIHTRVVSKIPPQLRRRVLVGPCSGAEVWGYDDDGRRLDAPYYSLYCQSLSVSQQREWRRVTAQLIEQFSLRTHPVMPISEFMVKTAARAQDVMVDDRGPQITFELVNACDLSDDEIAVLRASGVPAERDLRIPILRRSVELFRETGLAITPRLAGVFAIDFALAGVSKATAVKYVLEQKALLASLGLSHQGAPEPSQIQVWGDKFSSKRGGTDRHILEPLDRCVRAITFRREDPAELPSEYNIVVWDGDNTLQDGLLEYLQSS